MQQLIQQIEQWAEDRNLIHGSTPQKQMLKLMEEFGELCGGIAKNKPDVIKDSIGDCFVVLVILNQQLDAQLDIPDIIQRVCKNITETNDDPKISMLVFISIAGELADDIGCIENPIISLTQLFGALFLIANKLYLDLEECIQHAYDQIKDRKGKWLMAFSLKRRI